MRDFLSRANASPAKLRREKPPFRLSQKFNRQQRTNPAPGAFCRRKNGRKRRVGTTPPGPAARPVTALASGAKPLPSNQGSGAPPANAVDDQTPLLPAERVKDSRWRRGRDSNPRNPCGLSGFQDRRNRPLCHLSGHEHFPFGHGRGKVEQTFPFACPRTRREPHPLATQDLHQH